MKFRALTLSAASAFALSIAAPALAQEMNWDADSDRRVNQEEFNTGFGEENNFGDWDGDGDDSISRDEYNEGVFGNYDRDESGDWDEDEQAAFQQDQEDDGWF